MKVRPSLVVGAFVVSACSAPDRNNQAALPARRPNIVMVLVDDMRWDEMRVSGHPFIDTEHGPARGRGGAVEGGKRAEQLGEP